MKLKKSSLAMILAVVLTLTMAVGGTLAYLTDADSAVNEFTMGNVAIDLIENYQDGAEIWPGVDVTKEASIKNTGKNDAYVFMTVALPAASDGTPVVAADFDDTGWTVKMAGEKEYQTIQVDGKDYALYVYQYDSKLVPEATTNELLKSITLDKRVDYNPETKQYVLVENGAVTPFAADLKAGKVYVNAYAIQTEGFKNANEAYTAFAGQWLKDGAWTDTQIKLPDLDGTEDGSGSTDDDNSGTEQTGTAAEFIEALGDLQPNSNGVYTIEIMQNFDLTDAPSQLIAPGQNGIKKLVINGNGHTLFNMNNPLLQGAFGGTTEIVINDLTIEAASIAPTTGTNGLGVGAFANYADATGTITLNNCALVNSTVECTADVSVGGLVGYSSGDNVTFTNCRIEGSTITAGSSAGAVIGHSQANGTISGTTVTNCTINGEDGRNKTGIVIGTYNGNGTMAISGTVESSNTSSQLQHGNGLYGRNAGSGTLTIDGVAQ